MRFPFLRTNFEPEGKFFKAEIGKWTEMVRKELIEAPMWINLNRRKLAKIYAVEWTAVREEESV